MTIEEMHYDFLLKHNKVDSQQKRNYRIPEIDWFLNAAYRLYVKLIASPRSISHLGVEKVQRNIDDIRPLVVRLTDPSDRLVIADNLADLPSDYWYFLEGRVFATKGTCENVPLSVFIRKHGQKFEESPFDRSSFEWRFVNALFYQSKLQFFDDGTFTNNSLELSYIKEPAYINNSENFGVTGYLLPDGQTTVNTNVDCELSTASCEEIVDLAVMLVRQQSEDPSYSLSIDKLRTNELLK